MTGVKYHGQYPDGQEEDGKPFIEQHGYRFQPGQTVQVKEADLLAKFAGNRFFEVAGKSDKDALAEGKDEAEKAEIQDLRAWLNDRGIATHHKSGVEKLRGLKADYEEAQAKALDD